MQLLTKLFI